MATTIQGQIKDIGGTPVPYAQIQIFDASGHNRVLLFKDAGLATPISSIFITDIQGNYGPVYTAANPVIVRAIASGYTFLDGGASSAPVCVSDPFFVAEPGLPGLIQVYTSDAFIDFAGRVALTGAPRLVYGRNVTSGDDSAILIARNVTGDSLFSHAFRDESTVGPITTTGAYACYDANPVMAGSIHYNHLHAFQSRLNYSGSGLIDEVAGFITGDIVTSGTVTNYYGVKVINPAGGGVISGNAFGIFIDGAFAAHSGGAFAFYSDTTLPSFHRGNWQIGGTLILPSATFNVYGEVLTTDASGNVLANPTLTIVNGTITQNGISFPHLQLEGTNGNVILSPTSGNVVVGSNTNKAILATSVGANVASAASITPTGQIFHVTGTTQINTINVPFTGFTGQITLIPDGAFTTGITGNIALASTAVVSKALIMTYDGTKWYPSY